MSVMPNLALGSMPGTVSGLPFGLPFTMAAYHASAARTGLTAVNALSDQSLNILNNQFQVPSGFSNLAAAYCMGASAIEGQLVAPSLRKYATHYIAPCDAAANPSANPPFEYLGFYNPLPITTGDLLQGLVDAAGATEYDTILIWLANQARQPVKGQFFTAKVSSSTTLTAHTWNIGSLSFDTTLEEGIYAIVGCHVHFNGGIAFRFVFPGVANAIRPGGMAATTAAAPMPLVFRNGRLGVWGVFDSAVIPQMEFLGTAATTSEKIHVDLCKLSIGSQGMQPSYPGQPVTVATGVSPSPINLY
jgi:hypothetical protein